MSEAGASLVDSKFGLGVVPKTKVCSYHEFIYTLIVIIYAAQGCTCIYSGVPYVFVIPENAYFSTPLCVHVSVCTKSINLRVNILCLKIQHIIHHWKDLIE